MAIHVNFFNIEEEDEKEETAATNLTTSNELFQRCTSALFYGIASFTITIVNKNVLTIYNFPSVQCLGLGQMITTIILLYTAKKLKLIQFPDLAGDTFGKVWPLPLIYMGNMIFGLGGTKQLSLPMFTALRRFLILFTMIGEYYLLHVKPTMLVQISVYTMIIGALTAAYDDLGFSAVGYAYVFLNNIFSATNGVYLKQKLESRDELGKYGLMFYNSLFMLLPAVSIAHTSGDLEMGWKFEHWHDTMFIIQFLMSCVMGFVLTYSVILCTSYNSALATSIVGCFKNVCITYVGMVFGSDYIFSWINFIGINISVLGSFIYLANS